MPPGGEGYYFLAAHFTVEYYLDIGIDLRVDGEIVCSMWEDKREIFGWSNAGCSAVVLLAEGNIWQQHTSQNRF